MNFERFFIVGTTAAGKSDMALKLAEKYQGYIVNADSLQFFNDLKIGTAYPSAEDFKRVPHYLYGVCRLGSEFTAGDFVRNYHEFEDNLVLSDKSTEPDKITPLMIVGGSGFYIRALETGMFNVENPKDKAHLDLEFRDWDKEKKIDFLNSIDSKYLEKIGRNDDYRLDRALEIYFTEGKSMSALQEEMRLAQEAKEESGEPPFALKMGVYLEREELLERVTLRTQKMLDMGLIDEVKNVLKHVDASWKPLQSVGYKETLQYLHNQGLSTQEELKNEIIKNTMNLAKRQMTWFRGDSEVVWFHALNDFTKAELWFEEALNTILD